MVLVAQMVKNLPAMWETRFDPWLGISWRRHGNPLQYSCLENSTDRAAWWATVPGVAKSQTRLSDKYSLPQCTLLHTEFLEVDW